MENSVNPAEKQGATSISQTNPTEAAAPAETTNAVQTNAAEASADTQTAPATESTPAQAQPSVTNAEDTPNTQAQIASAANSSIVESDDDAALMAASIANIERPGSRNLGDKVQATLIKIGESNAFFDLGQKSEATMSKEELRGKDGSFPEEGSTHELFIIQVSAEGIVLGKRLANQENTQHLIEEAFEAQLPVEGKVTARNKGGLEVQLFGKRAFCPASHIELRYCENPEQYVGQTVTLRIIEVKENGRKIVVSRRAILEEEAKKHAAALRDQLQEGAEFDGVVTSLTDYGAFVEIGTGVEGLVHVSEISHQRVNNPKEALKKGQQVRVQVLRYDESKDRISLSMKALEQDPWEQAVQAFSEGAVTQGKVVRIEQFGAFVELAPGIDGLIHVSEISHKRIRHPSDVVSIGQQVDVKVIRNEKEKRRIGLSMKELIENDNPRAERRPRNNAPRETFKPAPAEKVFGTLGDLLKNVGKK